MDFLEYEGFKFEKGSVQKVTDPLTVEQPLQININGKSFTVVMQTPGAELELAFGLLYSEDVLKSDASFKHEFFKNKFGFIEEINIEINESELGSGYLSSRSLLSVSSCGICGKKELKDLTISKQEANLNGNKMNLTDLFMMQKKMFDSQKLFKLTGGCHGVAAFNLTGELLALYEDIGRHNALDKVVGKLLLDKKLKEAQVISFSGRISYEIVSKSFRAKIPFIMAVSAPSSLAIDFAKEYDMTILGFTRDGKTTCYSNPERIIF